MDFIEHFLHLSPDGGSGALETWYLGAVAAVLVVLTVTGTACIEARRRFSRKVG